MGETSALHSFRNKALLHQGIVFVGLFLLLGLSISVHAKESDSLTATPCKEPHYSHPSYSDHEKEAELFAEVLHLIEREFYDSSIRKSQLLDAAIQGMLQQLNVLTQVNIGSIGKNALITPKDHAQLRSNLSGNMSGIGVALQRNPNGESLEVTRVINSSPAQSAGIQGGDQIQRIDQIPVSSVGVHKALHLLRGPEESTVTLSISRQGAVHDVREFKIRRGPFRLSPVISRIFGKKTQETMSSMVDVFPNQAAIHPPKL